jgi:hypothetical protein
MLCRGFTFARTAGLEVVVLAEPKQEVTNGCIHARRSEFFLVLLGRCGRDGDFSTIHAAIAGLGPPIVVDRWYRRPTVLRALSFIKGIVWGVLWPLMWIMLLAGSWRSRQSRA